MVSQEQFKQVLVYIQEYIKGNDEAIEKAFALLDQNNSGLIDFNEVNSFLEQQRNKSIPAFKVHEIISSVDKDGDGKIDINDFRDFLSKKRAKAQ